MPVTALPRAMHRARPRTAAHRAAGRPYARGHLSVVPPQPGPPDTVVAAPDAADVARDAQRELVALGHHLHDGPVQSLIAASLALQLVERSTRLPDAEGPPAPALASARQALDDALAALRGTMRDLNPPGVQGGLGQMLAALRQRAAGLAVDDRATGAVTAEIAGAVFRLLAAVGVTDADLPSLRVVTRDRPGLVVCEVRVRGRDAAERTRREEVERALRRLDALGARSAVTRATGGADLLLALPSDTGSAPSPALVTRGQLLHPDEQAPAHIDSRGVGRTGSATALARTGTEDWR